MGKMNECYGCLNDGKGGGDEENFEVNVRVLFCQGRIGWRREGEELTQINCCLGEGLKEEEGLEWLEWIAFGLCLKNELNAHLIIVKQA